MRSDRDVTEMWQRSDRDVTEMVNVVCFCPEQTVIRAVLETNSATDETILMNIKHNLKYLKIS